MLLGDGVREDNYEQKLKLMTRAEIVEERKELLKMLKGEMSTLL